MLSNHVAHHRKKQNKDGSQTMHHLYANSINLKMLEPASKKNKSVESKTS